MPQHTYYPISVYHKLRYMIRDLDRVIETVPSGLFLYPDGSKVDWTSSGVVFRFVIEENENDSTLDKK